MTWTFEYRDASSTVGASSPTMRGRVCDRARRREEQSDDDNNSNNNNNNNLREGRSGESNSDQGSKVGQFEPQLELSENDGWLTSNFPKKTSSTGTG
mmetsp:Transcript_25105/g.38193  ORF Transcript_25105/g.38193 Transcript_25105/m.38193 type:complete len:97 (+) Transcript_25105:22-312(+)